MKTKEIILYFIVLLIVLTFGILIGILIKPTTPYEQTYQYLFNKVQSEPNTFFIVDYFGTSYLVTPIIINCSKDDYLGVFMGCKSKGDKLI